MNISNLIFQLIFIGGLLLLLPEIMTQDCIGKETSWCDEHQRQEYIWIIEGHRYLVKEGPNGGMEIIGLYNRYHETTTGHNADTEETTLR